MSSDTALRIAALCVVLAGAETLHGMAGTTIVTPRIGKDRAIKLSAVTGTLLAFVIFWALVPDIGLASAGAHLLLGSGLAAFMAGFDVAVGRLRMRKSWAKISPDFNSNVSSLWPACTRFHPSPGLARQHQSARRCGLTPRSN